LVMFFLLPATLSALALSVAAQDALTTANNAFQAFSIVPDVLPSFNARIQFTVTFTDPATNQTINVTPGQQLTVEQVKNEPVFGINSTLPQIAGLPYLIAMVDPDALTPENHNVSQIRHFVGAGFFSAGITNNQYTMTNNTPALSNYLSPSPPNGSEPHRYTLLLYLVTQNGSITPPADFNTTNVAEFNITHFIDELSTAGNQGNFTLVGGNFFLTGQPGAPATQFGNATVNGTAAGGNGTAGATGTAGGPAATTTGGAPRAVGFGAAATLAVTVIGSALLVSL